MMMRVRWCRISLVPYSVSYEQQPIIHHPYDRKSCLSIILAPILAGDSEWIIKDETRGFETHPMSAKIRRRLAVIPFELLVLHVYGLAVSGKIVDSAGRVLSGTCTPPAGILGLCRSRDLMGLVDIAERAHAPAIKDDRPGTSVMMKSVGAVLLLLLAWPLAAAAQSATPALDEKQLTGMRLFNQSCRVCHTKPLLTAPAQYGPVLSKESLGGDEAALHDFIASGTPRMPGFKITYSPGQIDAIVAYLKTVPPQGAAPK
jgi:mono/diheme cytochrome c family protein